MIQLSKVLLIFLITFQLSFAQSVEVIRQNNAFEIVSQKLVTKLVTDSVEALQKFVKEPAKKPKTKDPLSMAAYEKRLLAGDNAKEIKVSKKNDFELELKIRKKILTVNYKNVSKGILWVNGKEFSLIKAKSPEFIELFVNGNFSDKKFSFLDLIIPSANADLGLTFLIGVGLISLIYVLYDVFSDVDVESVIDNVTAKCQRDKSLVTSLGLTNIEQNETVKFISYMKKITDNVSHEEAKDCKSLEMNWMKSLSSVDFSKHCKALKNLDKCLGEINSINEVKKFTDNDQRNLSPKDIGGAYEQFIDKGSFANER